MPKGTRVDRCFDKLKGEKGESAAAAICQTSTKQSLATGKSKRKSDGKTIGSKHESFERKLATALALTFNEHIGPVTTATGFTPEQVNQLRHNRLSGSELHSIAAGVLNRLHENRQFFSDDITDVQVLVDPLQLKITYLDREHTIDEGLFDFLKGSYKSPLNNHPTYGTAFATLVKKHKGDQKAAEAELLKIAETPYGKLQLQRQSMQHSQIPNDPTPEGQQFTAQSTSGAQLYNKKYPTHR